MDRSNSIDKESGLPYNTFQAQQPATTDVDAVVVEDINKRDIKQTILYALVAGMAVVLCTVVYATSGTPGNLSSPVAVEKEKDVMNPYVSASKPNFIFVLADDLSWNSIGFVNTDINFATPHMSSMASDGVAMNNFYTAEICTPGRASLMTGRYPNRLGLQMQEIGEDQIIGLNLSETTLANVMKENGYTNYLIGKWNLGHYSPAYLPTARGFDQYIGYLGPQISYWTKHGRSEDYSYFDFAYMDTVCYDRYDFEDRTKYSTFVFEDKAVNVIKNHDFSSSPMYMSFSAQAVHDPFNDLGTSDYDLGIPSSYVSELMFTTVTSQIESHKRQQYTLALVLLDRAVGNMKSALEEVGQLDNTYFIFASDNGGCAAAGGNNAPLRGTKGSLYDGGTKVPSFIYSSSEDLISTNIRGSTYHGLMHMTDWFPTILDLAGIEYTPNIGYELDGVSHVEGWSTSISPRTSMVYGMYSGITIGDSTSSCESLSCAVRNTRYKLITSYPDSIGCQWYEVDDTDDDGDISQTSACTVWGSVDLTTNHSHQLYDLFLDPYETTNLYDIAEYAVVQEQLETMMSNQEKETVYIGSVSSDLTAFTFFDNQGYMSPFLHATETEKPYPSWCGNSSATAPVTLFH